MRSVSLELNIIYSRILEAFKRLRQAQADIKRIMASTIDSATLDPISSPVRTRKRPGTFQFSPEQSYPTPNFFIHTLAGSIPHLTPEVFRMSFDPAGGQALPPLQISIESNFNLHENIAGSGRSISQFVGLPECPSFLTTHDPLTEIVPGSGCNGKSGISIWPRTGRIVLDANKFSEIVAHYQPDFFQCLSDFDVGRSTSSKRVKKSTRRTLDFLQEILDKNEKGNSKAVATLEIGWFLADKEEAIRTVSEILESRDKLVAFLVNGVRTLDSNEAVDLTTLSEILALLPPESIKIVNGAFDPSEMLRLALQGVDFFDSSFVTKITNNGLAFVFSLHEFLSAGSSKKVLGEDLPILSREQSDADQESQNTNDVIISLKDKKFSADGRPLLAECSCYACRKYARSYIHHLFLSGELLGMVLLMSHNLFHLDRFFKAIRLNYDNPEKLRLLELHVLFTSPLVLEETKLKKLCDQN